MVKNVRDQTGRFPERPHYEPAELDSMFEHLVVEFLKKHRGKVEYPIKTDELTVLIERDAEDLDTYADLDSYGRDVEGVTEFRPGRKPKVKIAARLAGSEPRENRMRTTLTHEYGHVHLHGYLFEVAQAPSLFSGPVKSTPIICKRDTIVTAKKTDWMEWQAGYACGALLMPASAVKAMIGTYQKEAGIYGPIAAASQQGQAMIERMVETFQVSRDAARVRLSVLKYFGISPADRSLFD